MSRAARRRCDRARRAAQRGDPARARLRQPCVSEESQQSFVRPVAFSQLNSAESELDESPVAHGDAACGQDAYWVVADMPVVEEDQDGATTECGTRWGWTDWVRGQCVQSGHDATKSRRAGDGQNPSKTSPAIPGSFRVQIPTDQRARRMSGHKHSCRRRIGAGLQPEVVARATVTTGYHLQRPTFRRYRTSCGRLPAAAAQRGERHREQRD